MSGWDVVAVTSGVEFRTHRWLRTGHVQTVFAAWQSVRRVPYRAVQLAVPTTDDDQVVLHDDCPPEWQSGGPCVLLIHGLGGSFQSPYMVRSALKLTAQGMRVFRMDMRGCGAGRSLARKPGHAGRSEDVRAVVSHVRRSCPGSPLRLVGFSLGGNLLLKTLGEWNQQAPAEVTGALAVAAPIDLIACSRNIERPQMFLYNRFFVRTLMREIARRRSFIPELAELDLRRPPRTLYQFDDRVTAPLSGFRDAAEYYAKCSSARLLSAIEVPTTIVAAADDPIVPVRVFREVARGKAVGLELVPGGGHMGFFARRRTPQCDGYWLDQRVLAFAGCK